MLTFFLFKYYMSYVPYVPPYKRGQSDLTRVNSMSLSERLKQQSIQTPTKRPSIINPEPGRFDYNGATIPKFKGSFNDPSNKLDKLLENSIKKNPVGIQPVGTTPIYDTMYFNQYQQFTPEQKKIFNQNYEILKAKGVFDQYKHFDQLLSTFESGRTLPVKEYDDLQLDTWASPLSLDYSYPPIKVITGMVSRNLNDIYSKCLSTRIYRFEIMADLINRGELTFSSFQNTNDDEVLQGLITSRYEKGSVKYPFLNGLCYRLYDKFLNTNDFGQIFLRIDTHKRPFSIKYSADVLWDLTYTIINFNIENKYVENPYTNGTGCGINTFYLFELITREQALSLSIEHFEKYGTYGSPLFELSKYFAPKSNIINIPIVGDSKINQLRDFFTELAKSLPERNYTIIKLILRLDVIDFGHIVGIIKLNTILYIVDITLGLITYINDDILKYYTMLYDGIQIMSTSEITSEQQHLFDSNVQNAIEQYKELDPILERKNIEGACKEKIRLTFKNQLKDDQIDISQYIESEYIESEYQKLNEEERLKYAIEYLNWKSDKREQKIEEVRKILSQSKLGGIKTKKNIKKIKKKSKKILKKSKKLLKKSKKLFG